MTLRFGVFDHIEPVPGLRLDRIYRERLLQIERLDTAGFYAYRSPQLLTAVVKGQTDAGTMSLQREGYRSVSDYRIVRGENVSLRRCLA